MNFKPNVWKIITSIILGIVGGWIYLYLNAPYIKIGAPYNPEAFIIPGAIVSVVLIYIIWSLIQKK